VRSLERLVAQRGYRRGHGLVEPGQVRCRYGRADVLSQRLGRAEQGSGTPGMAGCRLHPGQFLKALRDGAPFTDGLGQIQAAQMELRGCRIVLLAGRDHAEVGDRDGREPPVTHLLSQFERLLVQFRRAVHVAGMVGDQTEIGQRAARQLAVAQQFGVAQVFFEPLLGQIKVPQVGGDHAEIAQDERGPAQVANLTEPGHALGVVRGGLFQISLVQGQPAQAGQGPGHLLGITCPPGQFQSLGVHRPRRRVVTPDVCYRSKITEAADGPGIITKLPPDRQALLLVSTLRVLIALYGGKLPGTIEGNGAQPPVRLWPRSGQRRGEHAPAHGNGATDHPERG
jgi:hypothetical protein